MTEEAWLPFRDFSLGTTNGLATAYLAYDQSYFYFAAKIADNTVDPGMIRSADRNNYSYFYPDLRANTFLPRQPKSPIAGGMPEVYARIHNGKTEKFSCRVSDNKGPAHELATGRSVSITNSITFHDDWKTHWANEVEFGAEP